MLSFKNEHNRIYIFNTKKEAEKFSLLFKGILSGNGWYVTI